MPSSQDGKNVTTSSESGHKKPYAPPKLTSIKLRPEEAVLGACKTATAGGLSPSLCSLCGMQIGS